MPGRATIALSRAGRATPRRFRAVRAGSSGADMTHHIANYPQSTRTWSPRHFCFFNSLYCSSHVITISCPSKAASFIHAESAHRPPRERFAAGGPPSSARSPVASGLPLPCACRPQFNHSNRSEEPRSSRKVIFKTTQNFMDFPRCSRKPSRGAKR